jgi:hypothetical protein
MPFTEILGLRHGHKEGSEPRTKHVMELHQQQGELDLEVLVLLAEVFLISTIKRRLMTVLAFTAETPPPKQPMQQTQSSSWPRQTRPPISASEIPRSCTGLSFHLWNSGQQTYPHQAPPYSSAFRVSNSPVEVL